jgi:hypothetical protein
MVYVWIRICVYWPVLLCNGRIDPEVLRVSYWKRENARCSTRKKQKPGGMDSAITALHLARHFIYIHRALCITYYKRGNDALPPVLSLFPHRHPKVLDTSRLQWFWTLHALLPRSPNSVSGLNEEISYNCKKIKNNYLQTLFWQYLLSFIYRYT